MEKDGRTDGGELPQTDGFVIVPQATAELLDSGAFGGVQTKNHIPAAWEERARRAWNYYTEEPIVKNCVNSWRAFAVGDEIKITVGDAAVKKEAAEAMRRLKITSFVKNMILQLLVKGDAVGYKRYTEDGGDFAELVNLNPVHVRLKYVYGELSSVKLETEEETLDLAPEQTLHLKWDAPDFAERGNSIVLPAFNAIELLREYRRAEEAIAKRWTTPFRLMKVGGAFGQRMVMPDQKMLEGVRDMVNKMDMKSGLVVPFYVSAETHGADGATLDTGSRVKELKEDILTALGLPRSLITGDGPNFATASVSLQKMMVMVREIKHYARQILDWIFDEWKELKGSEQHTFQFLFNDLDPTDAVDYKKLLMELHDRDLISRSSLQLKMELDPEIEAANREKEHRINLFDKEQTGPINDLALSGVLPVEQARELLGIKAGNENPYAAGGVTFASLEEPGLTGEEMCDDCLHFDRENPRCGVRHTDRPFDAEPCEHFSRREI